MATTKDICKGCGAPMESAVCHRCGWMAMLFPARVPKSIKDFESERMEVAKRTSLLIDENMKFEEKQEALEQQLETEKRKVVKLEGDLKRALEEAGKSNLSDLKGIIIISDMTDVVVSGVSANANTPIYRQCLPVLAGINTYGTDRSEGLHHQITIHCRGEVFLPVHFAVDTNHSRGLVIKDLSNGRITLNGNAFKEEYAGNSRFFIKQGRQIFTIEIKSLIL